MNSTSPFSVIFTGKRIAPPLPTCWMCCKYRPTFVNRPLYYSQQAKLAKSSMSKKGSFSPRKIWIRPSTNSPRWAIKISYCVNAAPVLATTVWYQTYVRFPSCLTWVTRLFLMQAILFASMALVLKTHAVANHNIFLH